MNLHKNNSVYTNKSTDIFLRKFFQKLFWFDWRVTNILHDEIVMIFIHYKLYSFFLWMKNTKLIH